MDSASILTQNHSKFTFSLAHIKIYYLCHMNTVIMRLNALNINQWISNSNNSQHDGSVYEQMVKKNIQTISGEGMRYVFAYE